MDARTRGVLAVLLIRTSVSLGYRGEYRPPGAGEYDEGDECPKCEVGTLKHDRNRVLYCKKCDWRDVDGTDAGGTR